MISPIILFHFVKIMFFQIFQNSSINTKRKVWGVPHLLHTCVSFKFLLLFDLYFFFLCNSILLNLATSFFSFKITNKIYPRNSIINFFNHKNFFRPVWIIAFCKNFFYFDILTLSPTINLGSLLAATAITHFLLLCA